MNKVELVYYESPEPIVHSLYRSPDDDLYLFCKVDKQQYSAICIENGLPWKNALSNASEAVSGLTFVCNSAKITVEPQS